MKLIESNFNYIMSGKSYKNFNTSIVSRNEIFPNEEYNLLRGSRRNFKRAYEPLLGVPNPFWYTQWSTGAVFLFDLGTGWDRPI